MKPRQTVGPNMWRMACAFFLAAVLSLSGCATPVGVRHLDSKEANRRLTESVLSGDKLSAPTLQILNRAGLEKKFQKEPAEVIAALHKSISTAREADRLFALAELSFLHATKSGDRAHFLAAAVYAYAFLFPQDPVESPDSFDPRLRTAVDLYNQGIAEGFTEKESGQVVLQAGTYRLPCGELVVRIDPSEFRWGPFRNEIVNDRELWRRYHVWLFTYNTGNPILYSGGILTQGLRNVVQELDPEGKDDALRKMVVIGHSQGGLLTKLTAIDSGDRFWEQSFNVPIDQIDASSDTRGLLRRGFYFEPLPFVRRVVFISTPHHGSHSAGGRIGDLLRRFISLPLTLLSPLQEIFQRSPEAFTTRSMAVEVPRSTDNMNPDSPFIKNFSSIPIAPGIIAHSIIAVDNPEDPKEEWDDGVVAYNSAHIDGVASEFVVHSGHSAQESPLAIEEVRRILVENLKD
ncbi:MAG: hypothetical protein Q7U75_06365 [Desulfobacterales bacterium]|nr:hypothetical protein [Desulfobacterales bacterium]